MKRAMRYTTIFICANLALILIAPTVLGLTRKTHLSNFIDSAETLSGGYQSTTYPSNNSAGNPDLVSTALAINMSIFFGKTANTFYDTSTWIKDYLLTSDDGFLITPDETTETMEAMYLATLALDTLDSVSSLASEVSDWIVDRRNATSHGFANQEDGITTTRATFYAIESLNYLGNISTINSYTTETKEYYLSCYNSADGGFAEIIGAESTLDATWAAVGGLYRIGQLNAIVASKTINYVSQFYFSSGADTFNFGGYGTSGRATVRDTFYIQEIYSLLSTENPNEVNVTKYLLSCQNVADGGFSEKNTLDEYRTSSMLTSYYAFKALLTIDNQLAMLNEEVWYLPFDWITLVIVLAVLIVVIAIGIHYYKKRRE